MSDSTDSNKEKVHPGSSEHQDSRPLLQKDRAFWGLNLTQFFGAFNDNLFKQLVMLLCLDRALEGQKDLQGLAMFLFAWPFIAFSGFAGFLSDRYSKRTIIVCCKVAEVGIVLLGMVGFLLGSLTVLLAVLCLMGVHSSVFGPSKYGILPELLRPSDLPAANGVILMGTFLAIILGLSAAGAAKELCGDALWLASLPCIVVAFVGLATSLLIRPTEVAHPGLPFEWGTLAISAETRQALRQNRTLLGVLLMSSVFWFVGGTVYPPTINSFGKEQLALGDMITGAMAACTGLGIAIGCVLAGLLSKERVRAWLVRTGAWGLAISLAVLALPGPGFDDVRNEIRQKKIGHAERSDRGNQASPMKSSSSVINSQDEATAGNDHVVPNAANKFVSTRRGSLLGPYGSVVALISVGLFAGFFSVPLQVFLQSAAPSDQKGRMIGAWNLLNWIGITGAAGVYSLGRWLLVETMELPHASLFGFAALLILPVALFYRPPETTVES